MANNSLNTKLISVPANGGVEVGMSGRFIKCLTSSGSAGDILISMNGGSESLFDILVKYRFDQGDRFTSFALRNLTGVAVTMKIYVGDGDIDTGGDVTISGTVTTRETKPATMGDAADVALNNGSKKTILPVDATRRKAILVSDPANTVNCRIGATGTISATRGALLQPGQSMEIECTDQIDGWGIGGTPNICINITKD